MALSTGMSYFRHDFFPAGFHRLDGRWRWRHQQGSGLQIKIPSTVAAALDLLPRSQRRDYPKGNLEVAFSANAVAHDRPDDAIFPTGALYRVGQLRHYWKRRAQVATR